MLVPRSQQLTQYSACFEFFGATWPLLGATLGRAGYGRGSQHDVLGHHLKTLGKKSVQKRDHRNHQIVIEAWFQKGKDLESENEYYT